LLYVGYFGLKKIIQIYKYINKTINVNAIAKSVPTVKNSNLKRKIKCIWWP